MVEFHPKVSQAEVDKLEAGGHFSDRADYVLVTVQWAVLLPGPVSLPLYLQYVFLASVYVLVLLRVLYGSELLKKAW